MRGRRLPPESSAHDRRCQLGAARRRDGAVRGLGARGHRERSRVVEPRGGWLEGTRNRELVWLLRKQDEAMADSGAAHAEEDRETVNRKPAADTLATHVRRRCVIQA